jgi:hypothetical protein
LLTVFGRLVGDRIGSRSAEMPDLSVADAEHPIDRHPCDRPMRHQNHRPALSPGAELVEDCLLAGDVQVGGGLVREHD